MINIRAASRQDLDCLIQMKIEQIQLQQCFGDMRVLASTGALAKYLCAELESEQFRLLVAEKDGHPIGYAELRLMRRGQNGSRNPFRQLLKKVIRPNREDPVLVSAVAHKAGYIDDIYVRPEMRHRGAGVGIRLYNEAFEWFKSQGATELEAEVWSGNENAMGICLKLGLEPVRVLLRKKIET